MKDIIKYYARFLVKTVTPMAIGSGEKGLEVDRLIIRDANGLPFIPGTSLAGVIRHEFDKNRTPYTKELFGFQSKTKGQGSRINFSAAKIVGIDGKSVIEELNVIDFSEGYYSWFKKLPQRDHARITDKGVAKNKGKFDEELLHKGTKFAFEIDMTGTEEDVDNWNAVLNILFQPFFRIGAGTRNGFGKLEIEECRVKKFHLSEKSQLTEYLNKTSSLNYDHSSWELFDKTEKDSKDSDWLNYKVNLKPENFFIFSAGYGDEDADTIPKTERYIDWSSGKPQLGEQQTRILIPATSIKGALSHRVAYHHNRLAQKTISNPYDEQKDILPKINLEEVIDQFSYGLNLDTINLDSKSNEWNKLQENLEKISFDDFIEKSDDWNKFTQESDNLCSRKVNKGKPVLPTGENNFAVRILFGYAKEDSDSVNQTKGARGNIIFSDVYLDNNSNNEKVFSHVAIDRFTGGGINGALFQEKTVTTDSFSLDIHVLKEAFKDELVKQSFENALTDLVTGNLQLGGKTTKGHGAFVGDYQSY